MSTATDVAFPRYFLSLLLLFHTIKMHSNHNFMDVKRSKLVLFYTVTPSPDGNKQSMLGNGTDSPVLNTRLSPTGGEPSLSNTC